MRSIALLTRKGGAGKTTLTASLAVAAAAAGEKVIAFDLDSQGSLVRWSERRKAANAPNSVVIEPLESERLPQLPAIFEGLAGVGFTVAVFDTAEADRGALSLVIDSVDLCLLPARPTRLDVDATAATFRSVFLAKRSAAFRAQSVPIDLPQLACERGGGAVNSPWRTRRTDAAREHRFSRCDRGRPRRHRVRPRRKGGAGNRGPVALDWRAADARITP